jgi:serine/threonine protein kinase
MLAVGTKLGPYEIQSPLGAGGVGEVYRARDSTLGRDIALKVLPTEFATDPERMARFSRDAQAKVAGSKLDLFSQAPESKAHTVFPPRILPRP